MNLLYLLFALDVLNIAEYVTVFSAFVRSLGGTPFSIGLINSSSALISLLWNPVVGSLSDQVGRKGLLIKCLVASATGSVIMAFSSSVFLVFIGKLIGSLGSPVSILLRSIVADVYKSPEERKAFFTKCAPVMSVAFLVGTLSGGFLSEVKHGYRLTFLLMATIMSTAAIITKSTLTNDDKKHDTQRTSKPSFIFKIIEELKKALVDLRSISWPRYKELFIIKAAHNFGMTLYTTNVGLLIVTEFNMEGRYLAYFFLMISAISITANILRLKLKALFDNVSDYEIITKGSIVIIGCFVAMILSKTTLIFVMWIGIASLAQTFIDNTFTEVITNKTTEEDRGKVIGAYENVLMLANFIVPAISGLAAEKFGERSVIISSAVPLSIAVYVANRQRYKND